MSKLNLKLFNGTEIPIESYQMPLDVIISFPTIDVLVNTWKEMTSSDNLSEIVISDEDLILGHYQNAHISGVQTIYNDDGSLTTHFYIDYGGVVSDTENIDSMTEEEIEMLAYIYANQILLGKKTIEDITNVVLRRKVRQVLIDMDMAELAGDEI